MFTVRPSAIHGLGLFATQPIAEGQIIGHLEGTFTSVDGPHVLWLDETRGMIVHNDLRYINHHDQPNAAYYDDLTVCALRDIEPGEEITHNYLGEDLTEEERAAFEFAQWDDCPAEQPHPPAARTA